MNILILNLTRFGDQLQSQAAINSLARLADSGQAKDASGSDSPGNNICLITLSEFASSAQFLQNIALTYALPGDGFLQKLQDDWPGTLGRLWGWRAKLREVFKPDLVCNLTPSVPAAMLGRFLAEGAPLTGFGLDEFGFAQESPWAAFFKSSSRQRSTSPFNIVDTFRAVAGTSSGSLDDFRLTAPGDDSEAAAKVEGMLAEAGPSSKFVAFQLGASEERRRWPVEYFAELGQAIWNKTGLVPLLLGGKGEAQLAERYASSAASLDAAMPHFSLIGRTNLPELACALRRSTLLVSNDTGTMHLAAGLGVPVLGLFMATAQPWDTGPYLAGSCSLEPGLDCHPCNFKEACGRDQACRRAIPPQSAIRLCLGFLAEGSWPEAEAAAPGRPRVWLAHRDEHGFMDLSSLSGHDSEARTLWFREQRDFLRQFLDRDPALPFTYTEPAENFSFPELEKEKLSLELTTLNGQLELAFEIGQMLEKKPLPQLGDRFLGALRKASASFSNSEYMLALGQLWQVEVQERGDRLSAALLCISQYRSLIHSLLQRVTD